MSTTFRPSRFRRSVATTATAGVMIAAAAVVAAPAERAGAADFTVSSLADAGLGSLRSAVNAANLNAGPDTITFADGLTGTINLLSQLDIQESVRIIGPGPDLVTIDGGLGTRLVHSMTPGVDLTISGLTLTRGFVGPGPGGGALVFMNGNGLTLEDLVVTRNGTNGGGGGISVGSITGNVTMTGVDIVDNQAGAGVGGGVVGDTIAGDVTLTDVTIDDNEVIANGGGGGGFTNVGGSVTIDGLHVAGNDADDEVGGFAAQSTGPITITGATIEGNTTTGANYGGLFLDSGGAITLADSTITRNAASGGAGGGARLTAVGAATVDDVVVRDNHADAYAGIAVFGATATVSGSLIASNEAAPTGPGGGLALQAGSYEIVRTSIVSNEAGEAAGATLFSIFDGSIVESTIAYNTAGTDAGGLRVESTGDDLSIVNSTISGNVAGGDGGAGQVTNTTVRLHHSTLVDNSAGGGHGTFDGSGGGADVTYWHTIAAGNTGGLSADAAPELSSVEYSLVQNPAGMVAAVSDSILGEDPLLGDLADNGGPTATHLPAADSPVVDAGGGLVLLPPTDQRGAARKVDVVDIGSVERNLGDAPVWLPVEPARLVDTRDGFDTIDGANEGGGPRPAGSVLELDVAGRAGVPDDARAVIVNLTGVDGVKAGYATAYPCLASPPNASSLNFPPDIRVGNEVIAQLDGDGHLCVYTHVETHLTVDVTGFVPAESPYVPLAPARFVETRPGFTTIDGEQQAIGRRAAGQTTTIPIAGRNGVPGDASAVIINLTAVDAPQPGYATVHPCSPGAPNASSLNYVAGINRGNEIVARLDANGDLCLSTHRAIHATIDVVGYLPAGTDYTPLTEPVRLLDTRAGFDTVDGAFVGGGKRPAGSVLELDIGGRAGIPAETATSVTLYLTAVDAEANGYATAFPCDGPPPNASSLNFRTAVNGGNEVIAGLWKGEKVCIYTHQVTHLTVDVGGYTTLAG